MLIREFNQSVTTLKGVGKQLSSSYEKLSVYTLADLLLLSPRTYEDRLTIKPLGEVNEGEYANTKVKVVQHSYFGGFGKKTLKVTVVDITSPIPTKASLLCFGRNFLERVLTVGKTFYLWGQFHINYNELQSSQFEMTKLNEDGSMPPSFGKLLPIYPLSSSLTQKIIRRDVASALKLANSLDEELPMSLIEKYSLYTIDQAIRNLHFPTSLEAATKARDTLAFIELFYLLFINRQKSALKSSKKFSGEFSLSKLQQNFLKSLSFELTVDQKRVLKEISINLKEGAMNRLLQGDVGSGKTLVAWLTALQVIEKNEQVAFMAPTELLARQHAEQAALWLEPFGIRVAFLTGSVVQSRKKLLLEALKKGDIDIIIGTHALFSTDVKFKNLSYIIIDEQHRFGVAQRISLVKKSRSPDLLLMSATPIPRSLALTLFGDLNISTIKSMPHGRLPVTTYLVANESRERMYKAIGVEFERGHQAYFVYPRIDDQGESTLRDVESMYQFLKKTYPNVPSKLIHSRLPEEQKVAILKEFREKKLAYLVSTSVVEVGIDVPTATCMVIEHAERFGLAALHQLRGRVGRSSLQSYCFLVYEEPLSDEAKKRLMVMKESTDGFFIAEQDLLIRGPGEVTGLKQSGFLKLRFASITNDQHLLELSIEAVDAILATDPYLDSHQNKEIRNVLLKAPPFNENHINS